MKRGGQVLAGILADFSEVEKAMTEMNKAAGSADEEMKVIEESISYKLNDLKETWIGLLQEMLDRGVIDEIIDMLIKLSEAIVKVVEANPEAVFSGLIALLSIGKFGGFKSIVDTISGLGGLAKGVGDLGKLIKGSTEAAEAVSGIGEAAEESLFFIDELADGGTAISTIEVAAEGASGEVAALGSGVSALSGALIALAAVAVAVGAALAWDHFTITVKEAEEAVKDTEQKVSDLTAEFNELSQVENRTSGQEKRLRLLREELTTQEKILKIRKQILAEEKYGNKFSDQFDKDNAYTQYTVDKANRYDIDANGNFSREGTTVKEHIDLLKKYKSISEDINVSEKERAKNSQYAEKQTAQLEQQYESYLAEILDFESKKDAIQQDIDDGYLDPKKDKDAYKRATDAQKAYAQWISQDKAIVAEIEKTLGTYDYIQDDIKQLASKWETGSISSENIATNLINRIDDFTEAEKAAFYDSIKNAKSWAEVLDIIDGKQEKVNETTSEYVPPAWNLESELSAIGVSKDDFEKYLNTIKELNPELQNNSEEAEKAAVANLQFSKALEDLDKNFEKYKASLEESDKLAPEYAEAIKNLADDLTYLTGVKFSVTEADKFLADKTNLDLLEKALEGNDEALQSLQKHAQDDIKIKIDYEELTNFAKSANDLIEKQLKELGDGGNVNLTLRPQIETSVLAEAGWEIEEAAEEYATVFTSTFSNEAGDIAINFTPIIVDPNTGEFKGVLSPDEFTQYCEDVIAGVREDDLNLQIGAKFTGQDAIVEAEAAAEQIHSLHELQLELGLSTDEFNAQFTDFMNWLNDADLGTLEAQTYLNESPFLQGMLDLVNKGKMRVEELKALFASLGWDIKWDEIPMRVPMDTYGRNYTSLPSSVRNAMKKQGTASKYLSDVSGGGVTWKKELVPTNIRFERNGGRTSRATSTAGHTPKSVSTPSSRGAKGSSGGGGGKSASDKAKDDEKKLEDTYDEFFDYFERRVKVLTDAISLLDAHLENVVGSAAKNKLLDAQERIYKMQQQEYADAKRMYEEMANKALAKIPDNIKNDIINGAVAIDEFIGKGNEEVVQAMQDYTKWADKIAECKQQLAELKEQLRQLELKRFKNIAQDWQDLFDLRQNNAIDLIDKQIDLFEEAGQLIGKSFYEEQKAQAQKQYELLSNERKALVDELNRGLSNGTIEIGSDEWLEMRSILSDLEGQILDCAKAIETFDNAILQLHVDVFERIQGQLDDFDDQLSDMASFLDDADVGNKYGEWSQEGMARAGLLAQQFDLANKKVHDYAEEIEWLNEQYKLGKYSTTEYMDRLADLMSEQRDAAQTADDMKDAMVELNRDRVDIVIDGINEEIKAYEELIDAQKKALQAQKDLHDYEKQVADENKAIVDIERQLAAIRNDDSAAANAKRKQLEAQLKDAQDQLSETEYDHSITAQEDALDAQMEQYRQMREAEIQSWEEYAANIEQVMIDMLAMVQANAFEIGTVITETATAHGFQISQALTDPWFTAQQTIAQYGEVLSAETSSFIASLENVEQETWNLQAQADATSVQLAQMFGNRADNLVNELQRSWNSEENLRNATNALNEAFVAAIDTGGQIGQIIAPLESAKAATDALADAADSAASAFDGMADSARRAAQEAANANSMPTTASRGTPYEPPYKTHVTTLYNAPSSTVKWDRIGGYYRYYAKGLSKADKDQLAWTQELGDEVIVSPTRSSILTPIKKGDAVIDAKGTRNLFELAKVDPKQLLNGMSSASAPTLQQNKAFGVNISSLVTVNGNVNDALSMMKIAADEAQSKITKTLKDLSDEIKY